MNKKHFIFFAGQYDPITLEYYLDALTYVVTHISPDIVIHRITADPNIDDLIEPTWIEKKLCILNDIDKEMKKRDTYQGKYTK